MRLFIPVLKVWQAVPAIGTAKHTGVYAQSSGGTGLRLQRDINIGKILHEP
jgi:hypothetical protein